MGLHIHLLMLTMINPLSNMGCFQNFQIFFSPHIVQSVQLLMGKHLVLSSLSISSETSKNNKVF